MAIALVRRVVFGALGIWVAVLAVEQFRLSGHMGPAIGLSIAGIVLFALAITGKGG